MWWHNAPKDSILPQGERNPPLSRLAAFVKFLHFLTKLEFDRLNFPLIISYCGSGNFAD